MTETNHRAKAHQFQPITQLTIFSIYAYETNDTPEKVAVENYFLSCWHMLRAGDVVIIASCQQARRHYGMQVCIYSDRERVIMQDIGSCPMEMFGQFAFITVDAAVKEVPKIHIPGASDGLDDGDEEPDESDDKATSKTKGGKVGASGAATKAKTGKAA